MENYCRPAFFKIVFDKTYRGVPRSFFRQLKPKENNRRSSGFLKNIAGGRSFKSKFSKSHQWEIRLKSKINLPCCFIATFIGKSMLTYHLCISEMMFKLTPCINCCSSRR